METSFNGGRSFRVIKIVLLMYFINALVQSDFSQPNKTAAFLNLSIIMLIIGNLLSSLIYKHSSRIWRISVIFSGILLYLALSAGLLQYTGEGGQVKDFIRGTQATYGVQLESKLNIPVNIDVFYPMDYSGIDLKSSDIREVSDSSSIGYKYGAVIQFTVTKDEAKIPKRVFILYRAYKIIPFVSIVDLVWPTY